MAAPESCPAPKMEKIVVASDGSEFSEGAVREAIRCAKRHGSKIYAVCSAQVGLGYLEYAPDVVSAIDKAARETGEAIKKRADAEGVDCEVIVHEGEEPYEHIVAEAKDREADAIILGRRGRRGLRKLLMGSVTSLVIGHAPCNVFVVPRAAQLSCGRLLVATDGSSHSEKAAREAIGLAKLTGGTIVACCVAHGEIDRATAEDYVRSIEELAKSEGIAAETVIAEGTPYRAIIDAAQQARADMIVVGSYGRTRIRELLMGSVTQRVVGLADQAVMVVK